MCSAVLYPYWYDLYNQYLVPGVMASRDSLNPEATRTYTGRWQLGWWSPLTPLGPAKAPLGTKLAAAG